MPVEVVDPRSPRAAQIWSRLECRTFFLSWGWIENWLACLPAERMPQLHVFDGRAAAFIGKKLAVRHRVVPSRSLFLNQTGVRHFDDVFIEYNGLVGDELPITDIADALDGWDELWLPGLRESAFGGVCDSEHARYRVRIDRSVPAYLVGLADVRARGFLPLVSSQTRSQIRRAQKQAGALAVEVATDLVQANAIYDELVTLHGAQWRAKGKPGAFADPWFDRFHRRLIAQRFAAGEIQLVRVRANDQTIGCLYNFVFRGRVLQYQSGFRGYGDARMKPGFLCHTAAIEHCARAGLEIYDLLGGDMRYKKSLATGASTLVWARVQRRHLRFALEDRATAFVRARRARRVVTAPHDAATANES